MNAEKMEHFLFRNYEYPVGRSSRYPGSMNYKMWEAVRASSAAPGYYEDYKLGEHIHVVRLLAISSLYFIIVAV